MKTDILLIGDSDPTSIWAEDALKEVVKSVDITVVFLVLCYGVKYFGSTIWIYSSNFKLECIILMRFS